jgi:hypothetical protein
VEILIVICLALFVAERGWFRGLMAFAGYSLIGFLVGIAIFILGIVLLLALLGALTR